MGIQIEPTTARVPVKSRTRDVEPSVHKGINQLMKNQRDLVEVAHTLKQALCIKG